MYIIRQTEGGQTGLDRLDSKQMDRHKIARFISDTNCLELHNSVELKVSDLAVPSIAVSN